MRIVDCPIDNVRGRWLNISHLLEVLRFEPRAKVLFFCERGGAQSVTVATIMLTMLRDLECEAAIAQVRPHTRRKLCSQLSVKKANAENAKSNLAVFLC